MLGFAETEIKAFSYLTAEADIKNGVVRWQPTGKHWGVITHNGDYKLSFKIKPYSNAKKNLTTNILHFTKNHKDCCDQGERSPAIFFHHGTTQFVIMLGDDIYGSWGLSPKIDDAAAAAAEYGYGGIKLGESPSDMSAPIGQTTTFELTCYRRSITLSINGRTWKVIQPTKRASGSFNVWTNLKTSTPDALVTDLCFIPNFVDKEGILFPVDDGCSKVLPPIINQVDLIKNGVIISPGWKQGKHWGVITHSGDYKLSFKIKPYGIVPNNRMANILNFTNGGQVSPAIYFFHGTTQFTIILGDDTVSDWGLSSQILGASPSDMSAPIGKTTTFELTCFRKSITLSINGRTWKVTQPTKRASGSFNVYASDPDPWYSTPNADVTDLCFIANFVDKVAIEA